MMVSGSRARNTQWKTEVAYDCQVNRVGHILAFLSLKQSDAAGVKGGDGFHTPSASRSPSGPLENGCVPVEDNRTRGILAGRSRMPLSSAPSAVAQAVNEVGSLR